MLSNGNVSPVIFLRNQFAVCRLLAQDDLAPVLTEAHYRAVDRRVALIVRYAHACIARARSADHVLTHTLNITDPLTPARWSTEMDKRFDECRQN